MSETAPTPLPLTETTFFILLSLAQGPQHGYVIMKDVAALSDARVQLSTGTLYGALSRLLEQGWIERADDANAPATKRPRKAYQLTEQGRTMLNLEAARLKKLLSIAQMRRVEGSL